MTVLSIGPDVWNLLLWTSLIGMIALVIPATLTGISERNHAYANWFPSHRYKLALSLLLMLVVLVELIGLARSMSTSRPLWLVLSIVVGNCSLVAGLSYFGLRITLGRQAFVPTSYTPDMDLKPPADILASVDRDTLLAEAREEITKRWMTLDPILTGKFSLDQPMEAFDYVVKRTGLKAAFVP